MMYSLPDDLELRHLTPADLPAVQALLDACESHDAGEPCIHEIDLAAESRSPGFDMEHNAWVVVGGDGSLVAVGWIYKPSPQGKLTADHYVRPDRRHEPLDDLFLDLFEERARSCARGRLRLERDASGRDAAQPLIIKTFCEPILESRRDLLLARGFAIVREIYQMRADLAQPLPPARVPEGIVLRPASFGVDDRLLHEADEDAFHDEYLHLPRTFEEWRRHTIEREGSDPRLWLVAWDGDEVAGQVWAQPRAEEVHVELLAVRPLWRRRGLGLALLHEIFRLLAERGYPLVRLFVDAQSESRPLDLYLRAGMRVERRFEVFEKPVG